MDCFILRWYISFFKFFVCIGFKFTSELYTIVDIRCSIFYSTFCLFLFIFWFHISKYIR
nr:MAG TPA: hypothetical protein [Caudoviricetes sp.]